MNFRYTSLALSILFLLPCLLFAQKNNTTDSLLLSKEGKALLLKSDNAESNESNIQYLQKALEKFQTIKDKANILVCYNRLSTAFYYNKNYLKYQDYSLTALNYAQANFKPNDTLHIYALSNRAVFFIFKEDYSKALELFKENLDIVAQDTINYTPTFEINNIGYVYQHYIGDFERALQYYAKAQKVETNLSVNDQRLSANIYANIGYCLKEKQSLDSAYLNFQKALHALSKLETIEYNKQLEWYCYQNISDIYLQKGQKKLCLEYANKALKLIEAYPSIWDPQLTYETFGNFYLGEKDYKKSIAFYTKAIEATRGNPEVHKPVNAATLLAKVLSESQKYTAALDTLQSVLQIIAPDFKNSMVQTYPDIASIVHKKSGLDIISTKAGIFYDRYLQLKDQKDLVAAMEHYQLASQIINSLRQSFSEEGSKSFLAEESVKLYENAIKTALALHQTTGKEKHLHQAFLFAESNKSVSLLESIKKNTAMGFGNLPQDLLEEEKEFKSDLTFLQKLIYLEKQNQDQSDPERLKDLNTQLFETKEKHQDFLEALEKKFPKYHELKYRPQLATVDQIQQERLDDKSVLLEYFVGEKHIFLFCISQQEVKAFDIPKDPLILESFAFLQEIISHPPEGKTYISELAQFNKHAPFLFEKLLAPCHSLFSQNIEQLIIVPDDFLNYLPFEILSTTAAPKATNDYSLEQQNYLFEDFQISYNFSASLLLQNENKIYQTEHPFAGFAPVFNDMEVASSRGCEDGKLYRLQCNQQEVEDLHQLMGGDRFIGPEANKNQFLQASSQYNILHLATHACLDQDDPNYNRIYFTDDHLSNFDLNNCAVNANLVVLSACNTNSGTLIKGDGVMSLSKGFTLAGCPSIVTSLWAVDDCSTSKFMLDFYQQLKEGQDKDQALQHTKLAYLATASKAGKHPYYWATFVQFGNTQALTFNTGWTNLMWLGLLGIGLLFFMGKFIGRKTA